MSHLKELLTMRQLAVRFGWPDTIAGGRRATRWLRRIEKRDGCKLIIQNKICGKLYVSETALRKYAKELFDTKSYVDRIVAEKLEQHTTDTRVLREVIKKLGARLRALEKLVKTRQNSSH